MTIAAPRGPVQDETQFCEPLDAHAAALIEGRRTDDPWCDWLLSRERAGQCARCRCLWWDYQRPVDCRGPRP